MASSPRFRPDTFRAGTPPCGSLEQSQLDKCQQQETRLVIKSEIGIVNHKNRGKAKLTVILQQHNEIILK